MSRVYIVLEKRPQPEYTEPKYYMAAEDSARIVYADTDADTARQVFHELKEKEDLSSDEELDFFDPAPVYYEFQEIPTGLLLS